MQHHCAISCAVFPIILGVLIVANKSFSLAFFAANHPPAQTGASFISVVSSRKTDFRRREPTFFLVHDPRILQQNDGGNRIGRESNVDVDEDDEHVNIETLLLASLIPAKDCDARRMSSTDLAYIGDVVYELFIRSQFVWPSRRTKDLQAQVVALVRGTLR